MASHETARSLILGTAGHIDHGKTSLVAALTGIDTSRLPEEKTRGITIDIGFANLDLGDLHLGIIDVPGHERFIKNMLAGAVGIDVAMLVIAADDGIMPQTREHLSILQMLDIHHGVVALTKTDLVEPDWIEIVEEDIHAFVKGTFLDGAAIVRTAVAPGKEAIGCENLKRALALKCAGIESRPATGVFRMPVDRAFSGHGVGTIVTGTVWSGELKSGEEVEWLPKVVPIRVRSVQSHGCEEPIVGRGQRAAANLIGVHHEEVHRGHELATPGYLKPSRRLLVELRVLESSPFPIKHRGRYRLHLGTQELMVRVSLLEGSRVEPGECAVAQVICAEPAITTCGQPFVLRLESPLVTVGGGHVLRPAPRRLIRRGRWSAALQERLLALQSKNSEERAAAAIYFFGTGEWSRLDLCRDANLRLDQIDSVTQKLRSDGELVDLIAGSHVRSIQKEILADTEERVVEALKVMHEESPLDTGFARALVAARFQRVCGAAFLNALLDRLISHGRIGGDEQMVMLTKHAPKLTPQQIAMREQIMSIYGTAGLAPPSADELKATLGASAGDVRQMLALCVSQNQLVHLGSGWHLTTAAEVGMRQKVIAALQGEPEGITMSQLRDALGTTRKYAVPFAEYLDRIGVTKRRGDVRVLNKV